MFFERVGYAPENASLMEGDNFWIHMDEERVVDKPPSGISHWVRTNALYPSLHYQGLNKFLALFGAAILMPVAGVSWILWEISDDGTEDPWFAFIISSMLTMLWAAIGYNLVMTVVLG
jgi:hypothetical protein